MITTVQVALFFCQEEKEDALQAFEMAREALIERGFITEDGSKKRGPTPGKRKAREASVDHTQNESVVK